MLRAAGLTLANPATQPASGSTTRPVNEGMAWIPAGEFDMGAVPGDDAARDRLVSNIVGHLLKGVTEAVLVRAVEYWRNVDKDLGDRIEQGVRNQRSG